VCSGATAVMTDNKVTGCHGGRGAGIANFGTLTIDGSKTEISSNTAYRYGGGIYNNGTLTVNAGKFSANAANSDKNPEKATEYAGANMYLSNDATIASAVSLDAGDVRVLDGVSKIVLSGVPSGTINVSISETAATYETQSRYAGYTVATGAGATDAGLAKLIYKSRDADASADNTAVGKWVFVKVPSANTIVVGQHAAVVYDPNASNFSGAAFAAGTTGLKSDGTVVKSYDIYSSTLPSVAKITDTPAYANGTFLNWYGTAVTGAQIAAGTQTPYDFASINAAWAALVDANGKLAKLLTKPTVYAGYKAKFKVTYDANFGSVTGTGTAPADTAGYDPNASVTVLGAGTLARTDSDFLGWATTATATAPEYTAGSTFTITKDTTLYAVWQNKFTVTYKYVVLHNYPIPSDIPDEVMATLPTDSAKYSNGATVTASSTPKVGTMVCDDKNEVYYIFKKWDATTKTVDGANVTFTGTWYGYPYVHVSYKFVDMVFGIPLPANVMALLPTDTKGYKGGDTILGSSWELWPLWPLSLFYG
jgi:hypothetical protein